MKPNTDVARRAIAVCIAWGVIALSSSGGIAAAELPAAPPPPTPAPTPAPAYIPVFANASESTQSAPLADLQKGRRVAGMCRTCHGLDGYARIPIAPHIGGESAAYLADQLIAFRDGTRVHEMMTVVSKGLSDQQIRDVSAWYAHFQASVVVPQGQALMDLPLLATCAPCHGETGLGVQDDVPNLAGETNVYIATQLKAFRNGKRQHAVMSDIAADLTDAEIRALADWYGALQLTITDPKANSDR